MHLKEYSYLSLYGPSELCHTDKQKKVFQFQVYFWVGISYNINSFKPPKSQNNGGTESDNALIKPGQ